MNHPACTDPGPFISAAQRGLREAGSSAMRGWYWLGMMVIALCVTLMETFVGDSRTGTPSQHDRGDGKHDGPGS
jgi:hypothetical protein